MNILDLLFKISELNTFRTQNVTTGSNRINIVGAGLEVFIREIMSGSIKVNTEEKNTEELKLIKKEKEKIDEEVFSFTGKKNGMPDLMLRGGPALEIKKIESKSSSSIQLNSSHPKAKIYQDDSRVCNECKNCETPPWSSRDLIYIVGKTEANGSKNSDLKSLWCVYGSLLAADREAYLKYERPISKAVENIEGLKSKTTNEFAVFEKVDPLGISKIRVRPMWSMYSPQKIFKNHYIEDTSLVFQMIMLIPEDVYLAFDKISISNLKKMIKIEHVEKRVIELPNPNFELDANEDVTHTIKTIMLIFRIKKPII